ncbi:hypothetical protein QC762_0036270 [Podospora pseudocomata]|uniref:Uncharacterized protein n=3 Tax=Podospora TaxID=5144 RepID=A0ABR0HPG8_9PEZI|nr:hypothetical protein QC762_0036270 [Podospora pseudocomata]KAK4669651.1 hypothetical protein QC763_0034720 [Podospora pseudopauciseta]KAK4679519.1 hypothetical protein QC764_0035600 [Podospora pseudoanserina]
MVQGKAESVSLVAGSSDVGRLVANSAASVGTGSLFKHRGSLYLGRDRCSRHGDHRENGNEGGEELK